MRSQLARLIDQMLHRMIPGTLPPYPGLTGMRVYWLVIWKGIRLSMPRGGESAIPLLGLTIMQASGHFNPARDRQ